MSEIKVDTVAEKTSANGVTVDASPTVKAVPDLVLILFTFNKLIMLLLTLSLRLHQDQDLIIFVCQIFF